MESSIVKISTGKLKNSTSNWFDCHNFIDMPVGVVPEKIEKVQLYAVYQNSAFAYKSQIKVLLYDSTQTIRTYAQQNFTHEFDWGFSSDGKKLIIYNNYWQGSLDGGEVWIYVKP